MLGANPVDGAIGHVADQDVVRVSDREAGRAWCSRTAPDASCPCRRRGSHRSTRSQGRPPTGRTARQGFAASRESNGSCRTTRCRSRCRRECCRWCRRSWEGSSRIPDSRWRTPRCCRSRRLVISAGKKRRPRRRTQRRGMEIVVAQPVLGDAIEGRRRNGAAERARRAEARIVRHDEQDVRGALGCGDRLGEVRLGFAGLSPDDAVERRLRKRKDGRPPGGRRVCAIARPDVPIQAQIELTLAKSCRRV